QGRHIHRAAAAMQYASAEIARLHPDWTMVTPAGEFRRACEVVGALSLVAVDPKLEGEDKTIAQGDELTIHVTTPERYGLALLLATGSQQHIAALRALARKKGLDIGEKGGGKNARMVAWDKEEDIY